jgi:hypothetical protein
MDFITGLPKVQSKDYNYVVVDTGDKALLHGGI